MLRSATHSLYEYLGGAREYLDLVADQSEIGYENRRRSAVLQRPSNWKLLVENSYDGYHGLPTHQRYFSFLSDIGIDLKGRDLSAPPIQKVVDLGNGHAVIEYQSRVGPPDRALGRSRSGKIASRISRKCGAASTTLRSRTLATHLRDQPQSRNFS